MSRYHRLPAAEKRAESLASIRERNVACPVCWTQVMPADLVSHMNERCPGRSPDPGPGARWVPWRAALSLGVNERTLIRWVARGDVRFRGGRGDRQYSERDLATRIALLRAVRRR